MLKGGTVVELMFLEEVEDLKSERENFSGFQFRQSLFGDAQIEGLHRSCMELRLISRIFSERAI